MHRQHILSLLEKVKEDSYGYLDLERSTSTYYKHTDIASSSSTEEMDFEELKEFANNQFKRPQRVDTFFTGLIQSSSSDTSSHKDAKQLAADIFSADDDNDTESAKNPYEQKSHPPRNERELLAQIIDECSKAQAKLEQRKIKQQLRGMHDRVSNVIKAFKDAHEIHKRILTTLLHENEWNSHPPITEDSDNAIKQECVDYLLYEMAGIQNKESKAYKELKDISHTALAIHMNHFIKKSKLEKYHSFEGLQHDFIKHLYMHIFGKRKDEITPDIFQDLVVTEAPARQITESSPQNAVPEPVAQLSILDRLSQILSNLISKLQALFCYSNTHEENENQLAQRPRL